MVVVEIMAAIAIVSAMAQDSGGGAASELQSTMLSGVTESLLVLYVNYLPFGIDIDA